MSEIVPRIIAEFVDYDGLLSGLRRRYAELNIVGTALDEIMCLPDGYTSKLLGPKPARGLTRLTLGSLIGGLGVRCLIVEDTDATSRILGHSKIKIRNPNLVRDAVRIVFTRRELRKLGAAGGHARAAKLSPAKRSRIARKAIKTRWLKVSRDRRLMLEGKGDVSADEQMK